MCTVTATTLYYRDISARSNFGKRVKATSLGEFARTRALLTTVS